MDEQPPITDHWLTVRRNYFVHRVDFQGNRGEPRYIVLHIQDGTSPGSLNWWEYGYKDGKPVQASATVMVNRDGSIWRVVQEEDAPWSNGYVASPTQAAAGLLALPGNANIWCLTIETEGFHKTPNDLGWGAYDFPQIQLRAVAWQVRDWMERYDIGPDNILKHSDIDSETRYFCPGDYLYEYVKSVVAGGGPVYARPHPVLPLDGTDKFVGGHLFHAVQRTVTAARNGWPVREWANNTTRETRAPLQLGEKIEVAYWVEGDPVEADYRWWVTPAGSRIAVAGTVEKPA